MDALCPLQFLHGVLLLYSLLKKTKNKNESGERLQALINALHALNRKCQEDAR
jgi:hypothetical protein